MLKKSALKTAFQFWNKGSFSVRFWDGEEVRYGDNSPLFTIIFHREPQLSDIKKDLVLTLGEAYMNGIIDFEGNLDDVINTMFKSAGTDPTQKQLEERLTSFRESDNQAERKNIHHHYDLGNDFFSLWLDKTMSYSCAYFENDQDTLYDAQLHKIDHSLQKLKLHKGERLLDIGCGWGWLVIRAAQQYGIRATGITLSEEQYEGGRERVHSLGLDELVDIRLQNYMDLDHTQEQFDKIVSIGMFEHVGKQYLPAYLAKVSLLLKDKGSFMLHSIMGQIEAPSNSWIKTYIFPGGYVPTLRETIQLLPEAAFNLIHLESLRRHYARTLDCWYDNFSRAKEQVSEKYDERFIRMWGLYLQGCASAFRTGNLDVYQLLMTKGTNNALPMTADYMYEK